MDADRMVTLKVNGQEVMVKEGTLILDAARDAGYEIPTFCYQKELSGVGSCRMCLVEIEGQKKLQPSCITPVMSGMSVKTDSAQVVSARASMLEFLLSNHALDCPICDKGAECELQNMVHKFGPRTGRFEEKKIRFHEKDYMLSPVIVKNSNRCVQCVRCVRVCGEVVGRAVLGVVGRGAHQEMTSYMRSYLDCDQDGMCIEVCPVGCWMRLPYRYTARPWDLKSAKTICPYCATGCRMTIQERDGVVVRSIAYIGEGFNDRMLCARGRFGYDILNSRERLTTPLLKVRGGFEPISWDRALDIIRDRFTKAIPEKIFGIASARLTNEELYLFQKLMRNALKSGNIDSSSRWDEEAVAAFISAAGIAQGGVDIYQSISSDVIFIAGTHVSDENPVTDYIVRYTSATRRNSVIIASPRAMKLDSSARLTLRHIPGRLNSLLKAVALSIYMENPDKLKGKLKGVLASGGLEGFSVEGLGKECGVKDADIKEISDTLKNSDSVTILAGTDFLRLKEGFRSLKLLSGTLRALGKELKILPVLDRCNQRGAWDMGVTPFFAPGYKKVEKRRLGCHGMLGEAEKYGCDAMYVIGEDIVGMYPDRNFASDALSKVRFLVVEDIFMTETAKMADIVLPGANFGEKKGTFTNQEGRVQHISALLSPPGEARTDLKIISDIGSCVDAHFTEADPEAVFEEIRKEVLMYADAKPSPESLLGAFTKGAGYAGEVIEAEGEAPPGPDKDRQYPYDLVTGNHLFYSGRLSRRSGILKGLLMEPAVEISETAARELKVKDGDRVMVRGKYFEAKFSVRVNIYKGTPGNIVFIGENFSEASVNRFFKKGEPIPRVSITPLREEA